MRAALGLCVDSATRVLAVKQSEPAWQKTKATNVRDDGFCCAYSQVERLHGRHLRQRLGLREPVRFQDCPGATRLQEVLALLKSDSICFASRRVNCGLWRWFCQKCKTDICDKCHRRKATWTSNSHADRQSQRTVFLLSRSDSRCPKRPCPATTIVAGDPPQVQRDRENGMRESARSLEFGSGLKIPAASRYLPDVNTLFQCDRTPRA